MPGNQDNNPMDNMSMDDINELYEDTIEIADEYKFLASNQLRYQTAWQVGWKGDIGGCMI